MENTNKALDVIKKILSCILIVFTVCMMVFTLFSTLTFDKNERELFGIRFYVVLSDSMSKSDKNKDDKVHFNAGDIVIIKSVDDPTTLEAGEIIAFVSQNKDSIGKTVTHRIREVKRNSRGELLGYVTYGTNTDTNDEATVEPAYVLGTYAGKIPLVGHFFNFLKTTPGYIVCILVPFLLLIIWQGVNTVKLFRQYKQEQVADIEAERRELAKQREESEKMLRELQALKEQLAKQAGNTPSDTADGGENNNN
ncbi:MAG: signal peptidase I [Clostridia bacterium]|nr:signal peptidase I [Clostridia bacterium]